MKRIWSKIDHPFAFSLISALFHFLVLVLPIITGSISGDEIPIRRRGSALSIYDLDFPFILDFPVLWILKEIPGLLYIVAMTEKINLYLSIAGTFMYALVGILAWGLIDHFRKLNSKS